MAKFRFSSIKYYFLGKFSTYFTIDNESEEHVYLSPPKTYSEIEMTREQLEGLYPHIRYVKYHNLWPCICFDFD